MRILLFADIHIGSVKNINYVYNVTTSILDQELMHKKTDAIILLGDYFHRLFKVNEEYTSLAINIISYMVRLCKKTNTKLRIIYGTESHEMSQYKLFNHHMTDHEIDMKIIHTVTSEELFPNVNVLYIPEEYIDSKESHYKKYLYSNNHYHYIFGHGVISEGMPMIQSTSTHKSNEKRLPIFKSKEVSSISDICVFGHYHVHSDMGDNCYYLGSLFRDSFGEEDPKGYGVIEDNAFSFVENKQAYIYKTYTYEMDSDIYHSADNIIREIQKIKEENKDIIDGDQHGKIRIVFKFPPNIDISIRESIRSLLYNDKLISTLIKESSEITENINEEIKDEWEFMLDSSLTIQEKIHQFMNKQYEYEMSIEEILKYIHDDLKI